MRERQRERERFKEGGDCGKVMMGNKQLRIDKVLFSNWKSTSSLSCQSNNGEKKAICISGLKRWNLIPKHGHKKASFQLDTTPTLKGRGWSNLFLRISRSSE